MAQNKKQIRILQILERNLSLTRDFMNDWLLFNQILSAYPSPGVNKAQLESQFLKIKSKLARQHQVLRENLQADYKLDPNTMNIVSGATNLESIYSQSEVSIKKLQNEWHRAFISINETLGAIEDKKARADAGEKVYVGSANEGPKGGGGISPKTVKGLVIAAVIIVIVVVLYMFTPVGQMYQNALQQIM